MKKLLTCTALLICCLQLKAQDEPNNYHAMIGTFKYLYNNRMGDSLYKWYAPEMLAAVTAAQNNDMITDLHTKFGDVQNYHFMKMQGFAIYRIAFDKTVMMMCFVLNGDNKITGLYFRPYDPKQFAPDSSKSNFECKAANGRLYGTITSPESKKPVPIVVVIAGSGPVDRDGNSSAGSKSYCLRMLADSLLKYNIACLRYDKRGIGESSGSIKSEDSLQFEDMVNDAASIVAQLKKDKRFSSIYILGHSEGSLVGMLAAQKEDIAGFISVAGAGYPAESIIKKQLSTTGIKDSDAIFTALDSLQNGQRVQNIPQNSELLLRKSVQNYLISWFKYDPAAEIKKLKIPVLVVIGNTDTQVGIEDAHRLHDAKKKSRLEIIDGMNHIFKDAPLDRRKNMQTYSDPALPIKTEFVTVVRNFVKG